MGNVLFGNNIFYFEEENRQIPLLDCNNYLSNKSRIPMHSFEKNAMTIPGFVISLLKLHSENYKGSKFENCASDYILIDVLLISKLIKSANPVKVAEIGSDYGVLSHHLASVIGEFNNKSSVFFVCNEIGEQSDNHLLENIITVENQPDYSMLVTDYDKTGLSENYFDVVVINGSVNFKEPMKVINEAVRIIKKGGIIIMYSGETTLLKNIFSLKFDKLDSYDIDTVKNISVVNYDGNVWSSVHLDTMEDTVNSLSSELRQILSSGTDLNSLRNIIVGIDKCVSRAISEKNVEIKIKLIDIKENLLNYIINIGKEYEEYFRQLLIGLI